MSFYFSSLNDFIEMGGHGFYVWLAYGIVIAMLSFYYFLSAKKVKKKQKELIKFYQRLDLHQFKNTDQPQSENNT